jgi:hypothetical protein
MQQIIVFIIIGLSLGYLISTLIKSIRSKKQSHCSGCGKD